jgi:hypothetical protein
LAQARPHPWPPCCANAAKTPPSASGLGAHGIEQSLSAASSEAFGPSKFVHFDPAPHAGR